MFNMSEYKNTEETLVFSNESDQAKSTVSPGHDELPLPSSTHWNEEQSALSPADPSPESNPNEEPREQIETKEELYVLYPVSLGVDVQQPLETLSYKETHSSSEHSDVKSPDRWMETCSPEVPLIHKNLPIDQNRQKATVIYLRPDQTSQPVSTQYISIDSQDWQNGERFPSSSQSIQENPLSTIVKSPYICSTENSANSDQKTTQASQAEKVVSRGGRIPRPPNAFMIFGREHRKMLAMQHKDETNKMISVRLGNMWRSLPKDIKDSYYMKAKLTEFEHQRKYPDYEYNPIEARKRKNDIRLARIGNKKTNSLESNKGCYSSGNKNDSLLNRKAETEMPATYTKEETETLKSKETFFTQSFRPPSRRPIIRYAIPPPNGNCIPTRMTPPTLRYHSPYSSFNAVPYRFCHPGGQLKNESTSIAKIKPEAKESESFLENKPSEQLESTQNVSDSTSLDANSEQSHGEQWKNPQYTPTSLVNQCPCHNTMMNSGHTSFSHDHPLYYISSANHPGPVLLQSPQGMVCPHSQMMDRSVRCIQANNSSLSQKPIISPIKMEKSEMTFSSKDGRFQASSNMQKMELSVVRERLAVDDSKSPFTHFAAYPTVGGSARPQVHHESQLFSSASNPCGPLPSLYRPRAYYYHHYGNGASVDPRDHVIAGCDHSSSYWMDNCLHNQSLTTGTSNRPEIVNALSDALDTLNYETSHL